MKLLFSEHRSDGTNYIYPYAIWAFPEAGETPADLFSRGFLPSSRNLDRFYLCRNVRISLKDYRPSAENRRILRKNPDVAMALIPRQEFDYNDRRRNFYQTYANAKFGNGTMTHDRLDSLFAGKVTSHVLLFTDTKTSREVGTVTLYVESKKLAHYYYSFYDLNFFNRSLGMFMMTAAVGFFQEQGLEYIYLGSCYTQNALYKTQFTGAEFFNGVRWSGNLEELKYLIRRESGQIRQHLLEIEEYRRLFYDGDTANAIAATRFHLSSI